MRRIQCGWVVLVQILREEIAAMYDHAEARDVLVGAPEELIFIAMSTLLQPGDVVAVTFPAYQSLYAIAASRGCEVRQWEPRTSAAGRQYFDVDDLESIVHTGVDMIVINFPHNPVRTSSGESTATSP